MDGFDSLVEAIRSVPVPGAPPRLSLDGAAVGLSFIETALRLNHVRRLTERISILEHRVAMRTTELDVSLDMLDDGQRRASSLFQSLSSYDRIQKARADSQPESNADPHALPIYRRDTNDRQGSIWVPVALLARTSAAPVDVRDATGKKLARLTQHETSRLLASGLYRLLRGILTSFPDARDDTPLARFLYQDHESRWLIQSALLALLTDRTEPNTEYRHTQSDGTVLGHGGQCRASALAIMEKSEYRQQLQDYFALLDIALKDYLLVVSLDSRQGDHLLSYESPLPARGTSGSRRAATRYLRLNSRGYVIRYESKIPANLRSYHLVVNTEYGVDIERLCLATNADKPLTKQLIEDLRVLAHNLRNERYAPKRQATSKFLELQTQTTLRILADLLRRRRWDAEHAGAKLQYSRLTAAEELSWAAVSGEAVMANERPNSSLLKHPALAKPEKLSEAADELEKLEVEYDIVVENEPITNQAHVYWRQPGSHIYRGEQISTRAGMILRDSTSTGPVSVFWFALALAFISYAASCFLAQTFWPYNGDGAKQLSEAKSTAPLITVLLLVPGFLYTRLALPDRHSVTGHLRALPRIVAHLCIGSMVLLSAAIAGSTTHQLLPFLFGVTTALPVALALTVISPAVSRWLGQKRSKGYDMELQLQAVGAPVWATRSDNSVRATSTFDVEFRSSGSIS